MLNFFRMNQIEKIIESSIQVKQALLKDGVVAKQIEDVIELCVTSFSHGHRLYFCGNGGSAADAQHLAAELSGRFYANRRALPAEALHTNTSYITAVANDFSFEDVYARLVEGIMKPGDVLICLSTSGNSPNIVRACKAARHKGIKTIGLTGESGGALIDICDICIKVPSSDTPRIQESHILIGHIICQLIEEQLFSA